MEDDVVWSYLRSKLSSTLKEAEADPNSSSQIISSFRSIERRIDSTTLTPVDLLYDLMDALSECTIFAQERRTSKKGFKYLFREVQFKNKMRSRLVKIDKNLTDSGHNATAGPSGVVIHETNPDVPDPSLIMGFESEVLEIEQLLIPEDSQQYFKPIGIVGRCGSGKTALAQKVLSSRRVEQKFFPRIWVSLSERLFDNHRSGLRERILIHILREIGGHDASDLENGDHSVVNLLERLRLKLMRQRYLIVLEDAWRMDEWFADLACTAQPAAESFTLCLPKRSGGAVIVTSRAENVIRGMVGGKHVVRPHLSDDLCWKIFSDAVQQQGNIDVNHPTLIQMKESVISSCQGLPLAAKTLANVISNLLAEKSQVQL